eukprot:1861419-Rhodomonas_salina.3
MMLLVLLVLAAPTRLDIRKLEARALSMLAILVTRPSPPHCDPGASDCDDRRPGPGSRSLAPPQADSDRDGVSLGP